MRIAMWSGPRNLSTALMYSFAARSDCAVWDEPFYAAYLAATGLEHPMGDAIIAAGETDPGRVVDRCLGETPGGKRVFYQKHMTQHMIDGIDRDWISELTNVFLIRHPARVIASYNAKREMPTLADIGFVQQDELIAQLQAEGGDPIVIDSTDILANPAKILRLLCDKLGLDFQSNMLHWPKGGHVNDGIWASHWYGSVWQSTGFAGVESTLPETPNELQSVLNPALEIYQRLESLKLRS